MLETTLSGDPLAFSWQDGALTLGDDGIDIEQGQSLRLRIGS